MTGFPWPAAHFDPRGRLSRRAYHRQLIGTLLLVVVSGSIAILVASTDARSAALIVVAAGTIGAGAFVTVATVRRLHDRGRTGWWLLPNAFVTVAGFCPDRDSRRRLSGGGDRRHPGDDRVQSLVLHRDRGAGGHGGPEPLRVRAGKLSRVSAPVHGPPPRAPLRRPRPHRDRWCREERRRERP